jgi:hypothetical protein
VALPETTAGRFSWAEVPEAVRSDGASKQSGYKSSMPLAAKNLLCDTIVACRKSPGLAAMGMCRMFGKWWLAA